MPKVGLYVTKTDKELLDSLPDGVTSASILRLGLAQFRREGAECDHSRTMNVCLDCGRRNLQGIEAAELDDDLVEA